MRTLRRLLHRPDRAGERGQGLVEFSLIIPVFLFLLLGMFEFGFALDDTITLQYATREGARVGSALVNAGGSPACNTVDQEIIAAVQRVLKSPGAPVVLSRVTQIRIYKVNGATGVPTGNVEVWDYSAGAVTMADGTVLDFSRTSGNYSACSRDNSFTGSGVSNPPESIGVQIFYTYVFQTPLAGIARLASGNTVTPSIQMNDKTVMMMNPTN